MTIYELFQKAYARPDLFDGKEYRFVNRKDEGLLFDGSGRCVLSFELKKVGSEFRCEWQGIPVYVNPSAEVEPKNRR